MFTIYGHNQCTYCAAAKAELDKRSIPYDYLDVRQDEQAMNDYLTYGFRTVPLILDGGKLVGGYDKLATYIEMKEMESEEFDINI